MSGNGTEEEDRCAGYLDLEYDATATVVCGINLFFGVVYCLFGYRCFKAVMFVTGFVSASAIVYAVCLEEDLLPEYGNEAAALGTGFLFGLVAMLVHHVGLFVTGLHTGLLAGVAVLAILDTWSHIGTVWVSVGVLLGCALIGAVLTLTLQKSLTIAGTSLHGGAVVAAALDYYVEKCRMALWLWDKVKVAPDGGHNPCWFSWLLLSVWPALFIVGTATQSLITGRYYYHTYQRRRTRRVPARASTVPPARRCDPEKAARPCSGPRRYRYVYQVRTAHGDVISQRYIQALRKMVPSAAKTSTLQSAYALCSANESDNEPSGQGTWSTNGTGNGLLGHNQSHSLH